MTTPAQAPTTFEEAQAIFAARLDGYTRRAHQIAFAEVVEKSIADGRILLGQAGTGTGKSFAVMIPAILSGRRTVVATYNKALQAQYTGDLEFLQEHLGADFTWTLLFGRANYPCVAKAQDLASPTSGQKEVLIRMEELTTRDAIRDGQIISRQDFPGLQDEEWRAFSMSADECPGASHCPLASQCFTERAKTKAADSDIVVTNAAYLLQDLILRTRTDGNVALLGEIEHAIIDEAHTLPDVTTSALEDTMGEGGFVVLGRDMEAYLQRTSGDTEAAEKTGQLAGALWSLLGFRFSEFAEKSGKNEPMPLTVKMLVDMDGLGAYFMDLYHAIEQARVDIKSVREFDERQKIVRDRLLRRSSRMLDRIMAYTTDQAEKTVRWCEMEVKTVRGSRSERLFLRSAPIKVGPFLREALWDTTPVTLVSATLAAGEDFSYLEKTLGLVKGEAVTYSAGTPFSYPEQALLFIPDKDQPDPTKKTETAWKTYSRSVTAHLVEASGGGALLLYTSRTAMNEAYETLAARFRQQGLTVLRQGDKPSPELIRIMKEDGNAVLFALRTFFEGVDVQGKALRLVVLDKLPFTPPTDLVHAARGELLNRETGDRMASFYRLAIPEMILVLTQAFGRLIRHANDKGVVAILDSRLYGKSYGKTIREALPPARRTSDVAEAAAFLQSVR